MLDDSTNIMQSHYGQTCILVAGKKIVAVFYQRLVYMHAAAVVTCQGFWHEGGRFAVQVSNVLHHVFEDLHFISAAYQRVETGADFTLASSCLLYTSDAADE